ncbi:MAG: HDOD domain-containing protein [Planctomycetota bacterium]
MLDKQFEELRLAGSLPSPAGVGLRILQITQNEDASLEDIAAVLQTDPTLTGRLLNLANSVTHGGRTSVTTVHAAAVRLGVRSVRNISLGFSLLAGNRNGRCQTFDYDGFWSHSMAVAAAAQTVAETRGDVAPADAFTCGLLQGMGRLALASIHPAAYEGVLERARGQSSLILAEIEQDNFGMNHREVAAALLRDWKLPEHFSAAVGHVGSGAPPEELDTPQAVNIARTLQDARDFARALTADVDSSPEFCGRLQRDLERLQTRLGLDDNSFAALWDRVAKNWTGWGEIMQSRARPALGRTDIRQRAQFAGEAPSPAAVPGARPAEVALTGQTSGLRILLVGEELSRTPDLRDSLADDGHEVTTVADGQEGLERALEKAPHFVLCDWDAPRMNGLQLVHTLRRSDVGSRVHFVIVAEGDKQSRLLEAFEAGADEYVLKPIDPRIVQARARAALRFVQLNERIENLRIEREQQIGQLAILTRKLQIAAVTDALTGLYNRRFAVERLQKAFAVSRNGKTPLSVIMLDIDRFKSVNDVHGHDTGDAVLRATAKLAAGLLRKGDALCRMGGEEFLAICPGADLRGGIEVAERLRAAVRKNVVRFGTFDRAVTVSAGVAQLEDTHADVDALLKTADRRVYLAKEGGRDGVVACEPPTILRTAG